MMSHTTPHVMPHPQANAPEATSQAVGMLGAAREEQPAKQFGTLCIPGAVSEVTMGERESVRQ